MNTATAVARPTAPGHRVGSVLLLVFGSILALVALGLVAGGVALVGADQTQRDADGYFTTPTKRFATPTYGITSERLEIGDASHTPDWASDALGTVRVRATSESSRPIFVGIAKTADVTRYLAGAGHAVITSGFDPDELGTTAGGAPAAPPADQPFWAASTSGTGTQTLSWDVDSGTWSLVVMNADGSAAVAAAIEVGANPDWVLELGFVLLALGLASGSGAAAMIFFGARSYAERSGSAVVTAPIAGEPVGTYPVEVEAQLDEPLSRWLWLVKWLLAIPHVIVLAFLWLTFVVLTAVAFFAILFTGRYPLGIFDFNLGVLRWTWRVGYYAFGGIGTDRYPPFSLGEEPDFPATLDVPYPERLSRGLVLVKSWLLAIPHLIVVALLAWTSPGVIGVLTLVAGIALLFRGRYPAGLHDLIVGLNRWVYRVVAYVALMRDEYPPFGLAR